MLRLVARPAGARQSCRLVAAALLATALVACGGGSTPTDGAGDGDGTAPPAAGSPPPADGTPLPPVTSTGPELVTLHLDSTAAMAQPKVPLTFGQTFAPGEVSATQGLSATLGDGTAVALQLDAKATHADGSLRHAVLSTVLSTVLPGVAAGASQTLTLRRTDPRAAPAEPATVASLLDAGFSAQVQLTVDGRRHTVAAEDLLRASSPPERWLQGQVATEWLVSGPLRDAQGVAHPHLTARFALRHYPQAQRVRVDFVIENNWAFEPGPRNFTYDVTLLVGGQAVYSRTGLTHYHHARWRKTFWWGGDAPAVHLRHDPGQLIASRAVPSYDTTITVAPTALSQLAARWAAADTQPMGAGLVTAYMPTTGGRGDIAPLPQWAALHLLSMDRRAAEVTLGIGDLAGSWPIHYRDKDTGLPASIATYPYMALLGTPGDKVNPVTKRSEAFPPCATGASCATPYSPDTSHQPSLSYLPYLLTGDHFHLEELQFWATYNLLNHNPWYRQADKGIVASDQVRGQAWSLRTLGHAAYLTPDAHPMKAYFVQRVQNNLAYFNTHYTDRPPNALGVIDGTGPYAFNPFAYTTSLGANTGLAPWQDDFFTWSVGHLAELGFDDARRLLAWKAQFPIGRMTAPGFCWIEGAAYAMAARPSGTRGSPLFDTFAQVYAATVVEGRIVDDGGTLLVHPQGLKYLDQPCGSQAQADWRAAAGSRSWKAGQMTGYAASEAGYPSNMQPALAVAATFKLPGADAAWQRFQSRSVKPDYRLAPQWAVVPRT